MAKGSERIRACDSGDYVRTMVVVEVVNEGTGWAKLTGGDYTVYDDDENVLGTGSFLYSFPKYLAPGATGYLADGSVLEDAKAKDVKRVEADGSYEDVDADEVVELTTAKVKSKKAAYGGGLYTTGTVTNESGENVDMATVGSFFLDAKGRPLGYAYTNLIENLKAGKTKGFETIDSWCPIKKSSVDKVVTIAADSTSSRKRAMGFGI